MERKIGEIFEYNGEWYQCVKGLNCSLCLLDGSRNCYKFPCTAAERTDSTAVFFKKLEKVGEPYFNSQYGEFLQEYKYYIPPITPDLRIHIIRLGIVGIELKQNKEDMEEYEMHDAREDIPEFDKVVDECLFGEDKPNLKPFNLEAAKAGKPVCTRDGRKARIICFDAKGKQPIIALFEREKADEEIIQTYNVDGSYYGFGKEDHRDLMMLPEKKERWVNVYHNEKGEYWSEQVLFSTKKEAIDFVHDHAQYVTTVKIDWEE